jgi:putative hydrolase of the HAD superfamily
VRQELSVHRTTQELDERGARAPRRAEEGRLSSPPVPHPGPSDRSFDAVFWDFGGVILSSPFDAFNDYEREAAVPLDTIRRLNATNPDTNAWARMERNEVSVPEFAALFTAEARDAGFELDGARVVSALYGTVRPEMVVALQRVIDAGYVTACLTNNFATSTEARPDVAEVMAKFHHVVESSKVGVRKPEPRFYEMACELAGVSAGRCVFLDDLGINLKPAAQMGMRTIKVLSADQAIDDLEGALGLSLR